MHTQIFCWQISNRTFVCYECRHISDFELTFWVFYYCSMFMARQFAWATKRIQWSNNIVKQFHAAARKLQQLVRHRKARQHRMATKIQALWKGWHHRMSIIMARRDELRRVALVRYADRYHPGIGIDV